VKTGYMTQEQEEAFARQAREVAEGGSGYLPYGSKAEFYNGPRGSSPYREHLRYLTEQLVLAGTGGILNMLATSGTGTLAGNVHARAFEQIARGEARKLSELMQNQLDAPLLDAEFPGRPHWAYFELAARSANDQLSAADNALKLSKAGYQIAADDLSERTGYRLAAIEPDDEPNPNPGKDKDESTY
jgi:phage gp29-like protein